MTPIDQRFWSKVDKSGDCWLWTAHCNRTGYGAIRFGPDHRVTEAHRVSYILTYGELPAGMIVCHKCDNPPCVNPAHLFLGTYKTNTRDGVRKGRLGKKLTPEQAQSIRNLGDAGVPRKELALAFGVAEGTISKVVTRKSWGALDEQSPDPGPLPTVDHLTDEQIQQIGFLHSIGVSWKRLAELYKVSQYAISIIIAQQEQRS